MVLNKVGRFLLGGCKLVGAVEEVTFRIHEHIVLMIYHTLVLLLQQLQLVLWFLLQLLINLLLLHLCLLILPLHLLNHILYNPLGRIDYWLLSSHTFCLLVTIPSSL
jgi:hypothetical protein